MKPKVDIYKVENMSVDVRLAASQSEKNDESQPEPDNLVCPGDLITTDTGFMRGHGTYETSEGLVASVAGIVERVNRLVCVRPLKTRYNGEVGDVVVGKIVEVTQKKWRVDTNSILNSTLMLSAVNLPGGELRRRSEEDEKLMRYYLTEGDLISAEVQSVFNDGALSLHTRNLKYGKLGQGTLVRVSPSLVKRRKTHFHNLPCRVSIILGNNGYIWVCPTEETDTGGYQQSLEPVPHDDREAVARVCNCVNALSDHNMPLYDTSILYAFEASLKHPAKDILKPEVKSEIVELTRLRTSPLETRQGHYGREDAF